jgi:hypothetical protein
MKFEDLRRWGTENSHILIVGAAIVLVAFLTLILVNACHVNALVLDRRTEPKRMWIRDKNEDHYRTQYRTVTHTTTDSKGRSHTTTGTESYQVYDYTDFHRYQVVDNKDYIFILEKKVEIYVSKEMYDKIRIESRFDSWKISKDIQDQQWSFWDFNNQQIQLNVWRYRNQCPSDYQEGDHDFITLTESD